MNKTFDLQSLLTEASLNLQVVSLPEQGKALGIMSSTVPRERFPELVAWMFSLMGNDDRENMTRIWQMVMPEPTFTVVKELIKKAIGSDWAELTRRIPTL